MRSFLPHLEPRLRVVPVGPDDGLVGLVQVGDLDLVLLRPLLDDVVAEGAREADLRGVVDVAAHEELTLLHSQRDHISTQLLLG